MGCPHISIGPHALPPTANRYKWLWDTRRAEYWASAPESSGSDNSDGWFLFLSPASATPKHFSLFSLISLLYFVLSDVFVLIVVPVSRSTLSISWRKFRTDDNLQAEAHLSPTLSLASIFFGESVSTLPISRSHPIYALIFSSPFAISLVQRLGFTVWRNVILGFLNAQVHRINLAFCSWWSS